MKEQVEAEIMSWLYQVTSKMIRLQTAHSSTATLETDD